MSNWYCSREDVREALDSKLTAYNTRQIDRAIETASRAVEGRTNRIFYPQVATRYFDFPGHEYTRSYRNWFNTPDELISATSVVSGGTTLSASDYFLEPVNYGPPYSRIEVNLATTAAFNSASTFQRQLAVTGTWGYQLNTELTTTTTEALDTTETGVDIEDSSSIGVGDLILIDSEYMQVTGKSMLDTTQNTSALTANKSDVSITGLTANSLHPGEVILIDSERMLIVDMAGTTATVQRAYDGSVLASHALNADIYALRTLTVIRASQGSTAASHLTSASVNKFVYPGPIRELAIAEALTTLYQTQAGYARVVGSGDAQRESSGKGLADLRRAVEDQYGRNTRKLAI